MSNPSQLSYFTTLLGRMFFFALCVGDEGAADYLCGTGEGEE